MARRWPTSTRTSKAKSCSCERKRPVDGLAFEVSVSPRCRGFGPVRPIRGERARTRRPLRKGRQISGVFRTGLRGKAEDGFATPARQAPTVHGSHDAWVCGASAVAGCSPPPGVTGRSALLPQKKLPGSSPGNMNVGICRSGVEPLEAPLLRLGDKEVAEHRHALGVLLFFRIDEVGVELRGLHRHVDLHQA